MVNSLSIIFMFISLIISIGFPLGLAIYFYRRYKISWKAMLVGALVFFVFQIATRVPMLQILATQEWYQNLLRYPIWIGLFLGLTAGLFEEIGRFLGFRFLLKDRLEWKNGVAFGIGHGGIEAVLLVGMTTINNIIYSFMINSGTFDSLISPNFPEGLAQGIKESLINNSPVMFLMGGIERIFAITIQIAFSLIVLYAVKKRKVLYLIYAILLHLIVDAPLAVLSRYGIWVSEGYVFICAVIALIFISVSKSWLKENDVLENK